MPTKPQHSRRYTRVPGILRHLREEAGLTQRQLADGVDQPQSWVHKSETGTRRVDVAEFCDWCVACSVEPTAAIKRLLRV